LDTVFANVTSANYSEASAVVVASFDSDDVVDLRQNAIDAGWMHNPENSVLMLNSSLFTSLLKDSAIKDYSASQVDALRSGQLPNLSGFRVQEAPTLPNNSQGLVGFIAQPDCLAVAMRAVQSQASSDFIAFEIMQDDVSGIVMTYAAWFDRTYRKVNHTFEVYGGSAKGNPAALRRLYVASS
jgi:DNA primase large subunit